MEKDTQGKDVIRPALTAGLVETVHRCVHAKMAALVILKTATVNVHQGLLVCIVKNRAVRGFMVTTAHRSVIV